MSLQPIEMKSSKRISTIGAGTHLCIIYDIHYLKNAAGTKILAEGQYDILSVIFTKDKGKEFHEQHYVIDGSWRQQIFKDMILAAQVTSKVEGEKPTLKDAKGHRLWISIKGVNHWDGDNPVIEEGEPVIEHFIFKVHPYIDNGKKPKIAGDPEDNNGIASGVFVEYNNIYVEKTINNATKKVIERTIAAPNIAPEKAVVIAQAKEMIKQVESGVKPEKAVEQPKVIDDIDWEEVPNF